MVDTSNIDKARDQFSIFLSDNEVVSVEDYDSSNGILRLATPWNDSSVAFEFSVEQIDELSSALNGLILPERFSAIYHKESKKLEIIWTAYRLPKSQIDVDGRSFKFKFKGKTHQCSFGDSSEQLVTLSKFVRPLTISESNHRNLPSFSSYSRIPKDKKRPSSLDKPRSFWITNCPSKEVDILLLIQNLNFYMTYFDAESPMVVIHAPSGFAGSASSKTRYIDKKFPEHVDAELLDDTMLSFWYSADNGNPMMRFLLYYRILEYAAVHYVENSAKTAIAKALSAPNARNNIDRVLDTVMGAVGSSKLSDAQRLQAVVRNCVDPSLIWREFNANADFFARETKFEGGFKVSPIFQAKEPESAYIPSRLDALADTFRKIRNALSHGKDQETAGVIRPTTANFKLFQPWVHLIATAAGEVVLYKGIAI